MELDFITRVQRSREKQAYRQQQVIGKWLCNIAVFIMGCMAVVLILLIAGITER